MQSLAQLNGNFIFFGTETGIDFADFLLGVPSQYNQSQLQPFYGRNNYLAIYAQDSWRVIRNLTLNYGLRWDRLEPWYEKYNQIATFEPGKSVGSFPRRACRNLVSHRSWHPTDVGSGRKSGFRTPRRCAYSPDAADGTLLGKILGKSGKNSIRASYGMFYTAIEAVTIGVLSANAPYGTTYSSPAPPLFATPFITAASGQNHGSVFSGSTSPLNTWPATRTRSVNWSQFVPISGIPATQTTNQHPLYRRIHALAATRLREEHRADAELYWAIRRTVFKCWRKPIPATLRCACNSAIPPTCAGTVALRPVP